MSRRPVKKEMSKRTISNNSQSSSDTFSSSTSSTVASSSIEKQRRNPWDSPRRRKENYLKPGVIKAQLPFDCEPVKVGKCDSDSEEEEDDDEKYEKERPDRCITFERVDLKISPKYYRSGDYEVERILLCQRKDRISHFLIKWKDYKISDSTWQTKEDLHCSKILETFDERMALSKTIYESLPNKDEYPGYTQFYVDGITSHEFVEQNIVEEHMNKFNKANKFGHIFVENWTGISGISLPHWIAESLHSYPAKVRLEEEELAHKQKSNCESTEEKFKKMNVTESAEQSKPEPCDHSVQKARVTRTKPAVKSTVKPSRPEDDIPKFICKCETCEPRQCPCLKGKITTRGTLTTRGTDAINVVFECNKNCPCNEKCPSKIFRKGRKFPLILFKTPKCGWCVRAAVNIPANKFVVEYVGLIKVAEECKDIKDPTYLFDCDVVPDGRAKYVIDATDYGNESRFFNHSCDPNLMVISVGGYHSTEYLNRLVFFSNRDISAGEELTFDYFCREPDLENADLANVRQCRCEAENCRKYLI